MELHATSGDRVGEAAAGTGRHSHGAMASLFSSEP